MQTPLDRRGFTLVELLIVVVIMGILVAMAIPNFNRMRIHSYDATMKSDLHSAMIHITDYEIITDGTAPPTDVSLSAVTGFQLSPDVVWDKFETRLVNGAPSVHMHLAHPASPNKWHADYPSEGSNIEIR